MKNGPDLLNLENTEELKTEKTKRVNSRAFINAIKASSDLVFILDDNGNFKFINNTFVEVLGYFRNEIFNKSLNLLSKILIQDEEECSHFYRLPMWKGCVYFKSSYGNIIKSNLRSLPLKTKSGKYVYHLCIAQLNEHCSQPISQFEKAIETSPDMIFVLDESGNILSNVGFKSQISSFLTGIEPGKNILDILPIKEDYKTFEAAYNVFNKNLAASIPFSIKKNGYEKFYEASLQHFLNDQVILIIRDVTNRKAAEITLAKSELMFRSIWEGSNDGMCLIDRNGLITYTNQSLCRLFKLNINDILGQPFYTLFSINDINKEAAIRKFQRFYFVKGFKKHFYLKAKIKSNDVIFLDVLQSFIESSNEPCILNIFRDVTKLKVAETRIVREQRLAEIGKVASFIVHELKSPLACLKMNIDLLARKNLKLEQMDKVLNILQKEAGRLLYMLSEISEFNKYSQLNISEISLYKLLEVIRIIINPILEKYNIEFVNQIDKSLLIRGDERKLNSVFVTLIENSIDAIKKDGKIEVYCECEQMTKKISIFVKDNGCGIMNHDKIFDPFYTTKTNGVGLGLPIVKHILEQHNGSIKLISSVPGETIFEINL